MSMACLARVKNTSLGRLRTRMSNFAATHQAHAKTDGSQCWEEEHSINCLLAWCVIGIHAYSVQRIDCDNHDTRTQRLWRIQPAGKAGIERSNDFLFSSASFMQSELQTTFLICLCLTVRVVIRVSFVKTKMRNIWNYFEYQILEVDGFYATLGRICGLM